jgi:hypothetical protein
MLLFGGVERVVKLERTGRCKIQQALTDFAIRIIASRQTKPAERGDFTPAILRISNTMY